MDNTVNCWNTLRADTPQRGEQSRARRAKKMSDWAISSQASRQLDEGPTTRSWRPTGTVKTHERGAPHRGEDIVWTGARVPGFADKPVKSLTKIVCDTANTAADVVGACFIRGDSNPQQACFGGVMTRDMRTELERDASARLTEFVATAKWGVGEIADEAGCKILSDA